MRILISLFVVMADKSCVYMNKSKLVCLMGS